MKITDIGTGHVGVIRGTCLAEVGKDVLCRDVDCEKIRILNEFGISIYEPGLQEFKPNTDDRRDAPIRELIADLFAAGATVTAYDPVAMEKARRIFGDELRLNYAENPMAALENADVSAIVPEWKEFSSPDCDAIKKRLKNLVIFDGRNRYDPRHVRSFGIDYFPIGR